MTRSRHLIDNMEWFLEELGDFDDDYLIIDCPGIIILLKVKTENLAKFGNI